MEPSAITLLIASLTTGPKLACFESIMLPDYNEPRYVLSEKVNGKCPEGFDEIERDGKPCRKFLGFKQVVEKVPISCEEKNGNRTHRRTKKH